MRTKKEELRRFRTFVLIGIGVLLLSGCDEPLEPLDNTPPESVTLHYVDYYNQTFHLTWSPSRDEDFKAYIVFEALQEEMLGETGLHTFETITDTSFTRETELNTIRFYRIVVEDQAGNQTKSNIRMGSSYGRILYLNTPVEGEDENAYLVNIDGSHLKRVTSGFNVYFADFSSDGSEIILYSPGSPVLITDLAGRIIEKIHIPGDNPILSPNGRYFAFEKITPFGKDIYIYDRTDSTVAQVFWGIETEPERIQFTPDGEHLLFSAGSFGNNTIFLLPLDGSGLIDLTPGDDSAYSPNISRDGSRIVFVSYRSGNGDVYLMNADGSNVVNLTHSTGLEFNSPLFSPSGNKILFLRFDVGINQLCLFDLTDSSLTVITDEVYWYTSFRFSPQEEKIIMDRYNNGIYSVNIDGTGLKKIAEGYDPKIQPIQ
ncbi:MAG: hypothetical protein GXO90_04170 [FCB group bacterium]|nr:hypothetical protein [FCB group bacterium]